MRRIVLASVILLLTFTGCDGLASMTQEENNNTIKKVTAKDVLTEDHDADIFQHNGLIYTNSNGYKSELDEDINLEKGKQISEVVKKSSDFEKFGNGVATNLPVGTKIYQVPGQGLIVLTVEIDDERIIYIAIIE